MIAARVILWAIGFMGTLWAVIGVFHALPDFGLGLAVTAASVVGWGLLDVIEER